MRSVESGRGAGEQSSSIHSPPSTSQITLCPGHGGDSNPVVSSPSLTQREGLLTALLSLRNLKICSLPPFPDNNKVVLKPTVWARRGPQHPTPLRPLPSVPEVMGWDSLVVTGLGASGNRWGKGRERRSPGGRLGG